MKYSVLVVDDDTLVNDLLVETLERAEYLPHPVFSGEEAVEELKRKSYDIVLTDLKMKEMDGLTLLSVIKKMSPETPVVILTAFGTIETAVKAIKLGAYDFLIKPVVPETVEHTLGRVAQMMDLKTENANLREDIANKFQGMIGKSNKMNDVFEQVQKIAKVRTTVMITGPSGTGKEMIARAIHYSSPRADGPFIKLNCAALPEHLVEAELFGHEKGAFTDAKKANRGRFEMADGGTLLLDEVTEMPINLQSKLLRVIQEREFERVGSSQTISVDVRILATSNRNLKEFVSEGNFREDLYWRLNVYPINLSPLEDRIEDVPLLARHFIDKFNKENSLEIKNIDQSALKLLMKYHWPGNVRELENQIERAVISTTNKVLTATDFPPELAIGRLDDGIPFVNKPMKMSEIRKIVFLNALKRTNGNKTAAADELGVTARTLRNWMTENDITL